MMKSKIFHINNYPWGRPEIFPISLAEINLLDDGISVRLVSDEQNIRATITEDNGPVCKDSCLEFFFCPSPDISRAYFNIEINPLGTMYVGFSDDGTRAASKPIEFYEFKHSMNVNVKREDSHWEVSYIVPFDLIKEFISDFNYQNLRCIKANFYKCGDETLYPHYAVWNNIDSNVVAEPDFHLLDYFGWIYF